MNETFSYIWFIYNASDTLNPVSYTHLDVYKRQGMHKEIAHMHLRQGEGRGLARSRLGRSDQEMCIRDRRKQDCPSTVASAARPPPDVSTPMGSTDPLV